MSVVGSQITLLALPLTAVMVLGAGPGEMGILGALSSLPWLLLGLPAGAWIDRRSRRPVMIAADLGRFLVLLAVPVASATGLLRVELLYLVAFASGVLAVLFSVAYQAFLPSLVAEGELVEANSRLEISRSAAEMIGPGLVGILVQAVTAPLAIIVDALSFVVSAVSLASIKTREQPSQQESRPGLRREMWEGLTTLLGHPLLRPVVTATSVMNLFVSIGLAAYMVFAVTELGLSAALIGVIFSVGGLGYLAGAGLAPLATTRLGLGRTLLYGALLAGTSEALIPLAGGSTPVIVAILVIAQGLNAVGVVAGNVNIASLRQAVTPLRLQGRVAGTSRVLSWGARVVGSLIGGLLAEALGLRATLVIAAAGQILAVGLIFFSPISTLQGLPAREPHAPVEEAR